MLILGSGSTPYAQRGTVTLHYVQKLGDYFVDRSAQSFFDATFFRLLAVYVSAYPSAPPSSRNAAYYLPSRWVRNGCCVNNVHTSLYTMVAQISSMHPLHFDEPLLPFPVTSCHVQSYILFFVQ